MSKITKLIHHIWIQGITDMNKEDRNNIENIKRLNPDWVSIVWDDTKIREMLQLYPDILNFYDNVIDLPGSINYLASKSDIGRFVIMYEYGGCYMDVDVECVDNLNSIIVNIPESENILACAEKHNMYSSQFFITNKNNNILEDVVNSLILKKNKGNLGGALSDKIVEKYKNEVIILNKYVSMYHCGSSFKCMIPIKINSDDNPFHPRRSFKYICDNRTEFMISGLVIILLLISFTVCLVLYIRKNR